MATNVAKIYVDSDDNITGFAATAIIGSRFVSVVASPSAPAANGNKPSLSLTAANAEYAGVSGCDQPLVGGDVPFYTEGIVGVLCSGGLAAGAKVSSGVAGVAVTRTGTNPSYGTCTATTADGAIAPIMLQGL